ncbi:hypothetical protein DPMN_126688 [Dreissena polymorpha]|uniref:Uncharacterized protein n=1 Tax=Dreissena polymorpha TaxID=45954 RepID=A0A9D4GZY1_DREPO|nr:hypothetical protein DPMN_126688 [Dreissena polymorpha]
MALRHLNSHIRKTAPHPLGAKKMRPHPRQPCFSTDQNHFQTQLSYLGSKCSDQNSWKFSKIVTSRVFTCFHYIHIAKNASLTGDHVFFTDLDHFQTPPKYP